MMKVTVKNNWALAIVVLCACTLLYVFYTVSWGPGKVKVAYATQDLVVQERRYPAEYTMWPAFQPPRNAEQDQEWFQRECLNRRMNVSIANIGSVLSQWAKSVSNECRNLLTTFHTIYDVSIRNASVNLPQLFQVKVRRWLGNNEQLFQEVYNQETIHMVNRFTREHTIFNPLRDKRPVLPPDQPEAVYLENLLKETGKTCDFCNFKNYTAEHKFHRVENQYAFSASNTFKMDTLHALFAMKQHDPLHWSPQSFLGLFDLSLVWYAKAHKAFPAARFPSLIWDVLPKCGASQVHPHLHAFLNPDRYNGVVESWRQGGQEYLSMTGNNFFTDMTKVASSLGLAVTHKSAVAFANLVPRRDHEVVVMAPTAGHDFFEMIYFVLRAFVDDLGKYCYSMGLAYPALEGLEAVMPAYARIITRGTVTDIRSDISSLELFTATNVNIDPFKVVKLVKQSMQKRRNVFR